MMPFTDPMFGSRSILTMLHGIALSGAALMGLAAALYHMHAVPTSDVPTAPARTDARSFATLTVFVAVALWLSILVGTYIIFPMYRATPPDGVTDLMRYPRALILADANTAWLHAFAMEVKEHVPWIAGMLATAVAFVAVRYRSRLVDDAQLRSVGMTLLAICFVLVSFVGLLGTLINKFAPLE